MVENERSYLIELDYPLERYVQDLKSLAEYRETLQIEQFYLDKYLRLRQIIHEDGSPEHIMTVKADVGFTIENEMNIAQDEYAQLQTLPNKGSITKNRMIIEESDYTWEIDFLIDPTKSSVYMIKAEVELPRHAIWPERVPSYIEEYCIFRVAPSDKRFVNKRLLNVGYTKKLMVKILGRPYVPYQPLSAVA